MCCLASNRELSSLGLGPDLTVSLQDFKGPSLQVLLLNQKSALPGVESAAHQLAGPAGY